LKSPDEVTPWRKTPALLPGESIASIVTRLAPFGLVTVEQLLTLGLQTQLKSVAGLPSDQVAMKTLAAIGNFELDELQGQSWTSTKNGFVMFGREMPNDWLKPIKRRLAPGVLKADGETPYARSPWQLEVFCCDIETGEFLTSRCCNCNAHLQWNRVKLLTHCTGCNFDLRGAEIRFVPEDTLTAARAFYRFLTNTTALAPPFNEMSDLSIFKAMEWFAYFADLRIGTHLSPGPVNAARGFAALQNWPHSFDSTVDAFLGDFADPIENASPTARTTLLSSLVQAIGRAGTQELHDLLLGRAIQRLGEASMVTLRINSVLSQPAQRSSEKRRRAPQSGYFFRDLMRSSQPWTGARPASSKT
jgi:hypothetical protein